MSNPKPTEKHSGCIAISHRRDTGETSVNPKAMKLAPLWLLAIKKSASNRMASEIRTYEGVTFV